jgi:hypothetical protein
VASLPGHPRSTANHASRGRSGRAALVVVGCGGDEQSGDLLIRAERLCGSDVGNPGTPLGIDLDELRLLRRAGLSSEEVRAATSRAGD